MDLLLSIGVAVRDFVLSIAALLKQPAAPGLAALCLVAALGLAVAWLLARFFAALAAIRRFNAAMRTAPERAVTGEALEAVTARLKQEARGRSSRALAEAWDEYRETLVTHREPDGSIVMRNALRPNLFFNPEELGFAPGFLRIVPGLFVTVGLFLTFLGLIAALHSMDLSKDHVEGSLSDLLTVASAKFIMSLTGLACSIVFTIALRLCTERLDGALHRLCAELEKRLSFISLEGLATEQLTAIREQREHLRAFGLELVAELGRPLKEDIPNAIATSISSAMGPLNLMVVSMCCDPGVPQGPCPLASCGHSPHGWLSFSGTRVCSLLAINDESDPETGQELWPQNIFSASNASRSKPLQVVEAPREDCNDVKRGHKFGKRLI